MEWQALSLDLMMLLFCAKHILHNNLPVSVKSPNLRVAVGRHVSREMSPNRGSITKNSKNVYRLSCELCYNARK